MKGKGGKRKDRNGGDVRGDTSKEKKREAGGNKTSWETGIRKEKGRKEGGER